MYLSIFISYSTFQIYKLLYQLYLRIVNHEYLLKNRSGKDEVNLKINKNGVKSTINSTTL